MKSSVIALSVEFIDHHVYVTFHRRLFAKVKSVTRHQANFRPSIRRLERYLVKTNDFRVVDVHLAGAPGIDYLRK